MTNPRDRQSFRLVDAMILLAATSVGLAGWRYLFGTISRFDPIVGPASVTFVPVYHQAWRPNDLATAAALMLAALSPGLLICAYGRNPRALGGITQRRSVFACGVAAAIAMGFLGWNLYHARTYGWPAYPPTEMNMNEIPAAPRLIDLPDGRRIPFQIDRFPEYVLPRLSRRVGPAILLTWLVLALARRERKPIGWVDRASLIVGIAWVLTSLAQIAIWAQGYVVPLANIRHWDPF